MDWLNNLVNTYIGTLYINIYLFIYISRHNLIGLILNFVPNELLSVKIEKSKPKMDSLHFITNNIFTRLFKELTKYKNSY